MAENRDPTISSYQLRKGHRIISVPWQGLADTRQSLADEDDLWVHVDSASIEEIEEGLKRNDIHPLILPDLPSDSFVNLQVDAAFDPAIHNI